MMNEISPRTMARLTGASYLVLMAGGIVAQGMIAEKLINLRDAAATSSAILANENLYRTAFTVYLIEMTAQIVLSVLFYYLLKPVSRSGAMVSTVLLLTGSVIKTMTRLFFISPLYVLHGGSVFAGFSPEQLNSLALMLLRINNEGAAIALAFFGPATLIQGWLIFKSTFLPKWMGVIAIVGGIAWTTFYWPTLGKSLFNVSATIALIGSLATIAWLIIVGVNEERWRERAAASAASSIWR